MVLLRSQNLVIENSVVACPSRSKMRKWEVDRSSQTRTDSYGLNDIL